jgi:mono/diheme cytochrome c family protein
MGVSRYGLAALTLFGSAVAAQAPFDLGDANRIDSGKRRFAGTCAAYCHGKEGVGGRAPSFKGNPFFDHEAAFKVITGGRQGQGTMPPWGNAFSPEEIWELVAYLDHLSKMTE